jgi:hypothetical protein
LVAPAVVGVVVGATALAPPAQAGIIMPDRPAAVGGLLDIVFPTIGGITARNSGRAAPR